MSVRLLILGLLKRGSLHGYEIKRIIEKEMADWSHVSVGSIYFALEKMAEEGLLERSLPEREGKRPARTVYGINDSGTREFLRLLRETWSSPEFFRFSLDFGLAFMDDLDPAEVRTLLVARIESLEGTLAGLAAHEREVLNNPEVPASAQFIFSHHETHYRAELQWMRDVLARLA